MVTGMNRKNIVLTATSIGAALGVAGLVSLAVPAGAGERPSLPDVTAEELMTSLLEAQPPAMGGTVEADNRLGLPTLPGMGTLSRADVELRVWADGDGRSRLSVPSRTGERTVVNDGETVWSWDSASRTVTRSPMTGSPAGAEQLDPTTAVRELLGAVEDSSTVTVDDTAEVAGRDAYELVLAPAPTERTLLREIRVAVDAAERLPLRLEVLAHGSTEPVFAIGFTELDVAPQNPELFRFTPPDGATVTEPEDLPDHLPEGTVPGVHEFADLFELFGDGWDTVLVAELPDDLFTGNFPGSTHRDDRDGRGPWRHGNTGGFNPGMLLEQIGSPVRGEWGEGTMITSAVVSAIITTDGRIAAGAVPEQVLVEALSR